MALVKNTGDVPAGAVLLSEAEAMDYQWKLIADWKPQGDVWPFRYGFAILGGLSSLSGMYINNHYRNKLKLGSFGRVSTYLPMVALPGIMSALFHQQAISTDIVLGKAECPVCLETQAAAIQSLFGIIYPAILAPIAGFMFATRHHTFYIPPITSQYKEVWQLYRKLTKPLGIPFMAFFFFHAVTACFITHQEAKSYFKIQNKLYEIEKEYENNKSMNSIL